MKWNRTNFSTLPHVTGTGTGTGTDFISRIFKRSRLKRDCLVDFDKGERNCSNSLHFCFEDLAVFIHNDQPLTVRMKYVWVRDSCTKREPMLSSMFGFNERKKA